MDRVKKLRLVYGLALADLAIVVIWMVFFDIPGMFGAAGFAATSFATIFYAVGVCSFVLVGAPLAFLLWKPMGWGKLLMPVYGLAWIMHGAIISLMRTMTGSPLHVAGPWVPIGCGVAMFALAIAHQLIDPSFFRDRPA